MHLIWEVLQDFLLRDGILQKSNYPEYYLC